MEMGVKKLDTLVQSSEERAELETKLKKKKKKIPITLIDSYYIFLLFPVILESCFKLFTKYWNIRNGLRSSITSHFRLLSNIKQVG